MLKIAKESDAFARKMLPLIRQCHTMAVSLYKELDAEGSIVSSAFFTTMSDFDPNGGNVINELTAASRRLFHDVDSLEREKKYLN